MTDYLTSLFILSTMVLTIASFALTLAAAYYASKGNFAEDHQQLLSLTKLTTAISLCSPFLWCVFSDPYLLYDNMESAVSFYGMNTIVWLAAILISEVTLLIAKRTKRFIYYKFVKSIRTITIGAWVSSLLLGWLLA